MGFGAFDVTASAPSHSALAGVLAAIVIAILPFVATRNGSEHGPAPMADGTREFSVRLLVIAMFLLVVAAVVWGSVSGSPSRDTVIERATEKYSEYVNDELSRSVTIAAAGTVLLALGAICLAAGLLTYVNSRLASDLGSFMNATVTLLGALAVYEIAFFVLGDISLLWMPEWQSINLTSLIATAIALSPMSSRVRTALSHLFRPDLSWKLVTAASMLAVTAYATSPVPATAPTDYAATLWDHLSVGALCGAGILAIASVLAIASDINRHAFMRSED